MASLRLCLRDDGVSRDAAFAAVTANGGALRRLDVRNIPLSAAGDPTRATGDTDVSVFLLKDDVDAVLRSTPNLLSFDADVTCSCFQDAQTLLAGQG